MMVFRKLASFAALGVALQLDQTTNVEACGCIPFSNVCYNSATIIARVITESAFM